MKRVLLTIGLGAAVLVTSTLAATAAPKGKSRELRIGDGSDWMFVNSKWIDTDAGGIAGANIGDGDGWQGYVLAFNKTEAYSDLEATFTAQTGNRIMGDPTGDIGLIVRAQDPTHYYLIHFPQCGQSFRGQHFWAALSVADGSGYLRIRKLEFVRRVASNPFGLAHQVRVKVTGDRIQVWLNGHPALDVRDATYSQGRIGLAGFGTFSHGKVVVTGTDVAASPWNESMKQVRNWFNPFPDVNGQQGGVSLTKAPNGDLLCTFTSSYTLAGFDAEANIKRYLGRSTDGGRTWTAELLPKSSDEREGSMHLLKDGKLVRIAVVNGKGSWSESPDNGRTWTNVTPIVPTGAWPKDLKTIGTGPQLELRDGTLIRFALGGHSTSSEPITKWGAVHCQAFSIRSTDGGKTWSTPVNLDASDNKAMGNLDLTEAVGFETKDGRIMCLIRPIYSPWMWETWSYDQGKTWSPCVRGPFPGWAPSQVVKTIAGAAMFPTRFPGLTLHHTRDDGLTWDEGGGGTYIDTSRWAMGGLVEVEPNVVLYVYMDHWTDLSNARGSGRPAKLRAQFIRMTDQGLMPVRR